MKLYIVLFSFTVLNGMENQNKPMLITNYQEVTIPTIEFTVSKQRNSSEVATSMSNSFRQLTPILCAFTEIQPEIKNKINRRECKFCKKEYSRTYLQTHIKLAHFQIRPFICIYCQKTFNNRQQHNSKMCQFNQIMRGTPNDN